jgi:hypothetical protein
MARNSTCLLEVEKSFACAAQQYQLAPNFNAAGPQSKHPERRNASTTVVGRIQMKLSNGSQKPTLSTGKPLKKLRSSTDMTVL